MNIKFNFSANAVNFCVSVVIELDAQWTVINLKLVHFVFTLLFQVLLFFVALYLRWIQVAAEPRNMMYCMKFKRFFVLPLNFLFSTCLWVFGIFFSLFFNIQRMHQSPISCIFSGPLAIYMLLLHSQSRMMKTDYDFYCANMPEKNDGDFFSWPKLNAIANMRFRYTKLEITHTHTWSFPLVLPKCNTLECVAHATRDINIFGLYSTMTDERSSSFWYFFIHFFYTCSTFFHSQTLNNMSNLINHFGSITRNKQFEREIWYRFVWMDTNKKKVSF